MVTIPPSSLIGDGGMGGGIGGGIGCGGRIGEMMRDDVTGIGGEVRDVVRRLPYLTSPGEEEMVVIEDVCKHPMVRRMVISHILNHYDEVGCEDGIHQVVGDGMRRLWDTIPSSLPSINSLSIMREIYIEEMCDVWEIGMRDSRDVLVRMWEEEDMVVREWDGMMWDTSLVGEEG